MMSLTKGEQE